MACDVTSGRESSSAHGLNRLSFEVDVKALNLISSDPELSALLSSLCVDSRGRSFLIVINGFFESKLASVYLFGTLTDLSDRLLLLSYAIDDLEIFTNLFCGCSLVSLKSIIIKLLLAHKLTLVLVV